MPLDRKLFEKEANTLLDELLDAIYLKYEGRYDEAIDCLDNVIISAGLIAQKDPELGKRFEMNTIISAVKGYQLAAYTLKLKNANTTERDKISKKMEDIARGELDRTSSHYLEIMSAFNELTGQDLDEYFFMILERVLRPQKKAF